MSSMGRAFLAVVVVAVLSACNQNNDRTALTQTCVDQGESMEACACIATALEDNLSPKLYKRTVQVVAREKRDVEKFIDSLPIEQQGEYEKALDSMFSCKLAPPVEETESN